MINVMQLKAKIKDIASTNRVPVQSVWESYILEKLLIAISKTKYRNCLILKGGLLISSLVGVNQRSTMDMDLTVKNYPLDLQTVTRMFMDICESTSNDEFAFSLSGIGKIREDDEYDGFRIKLKASYQKLCIDLKVDITTGDKITPGAVEFEYKKRFDSGYIKLFAYNVETILAEKIETIISRGPLNTRARDFYDVYILTRTSKNSINMMVFKEALQSTCHKRNSSQLINDYKNILETIGSDKDMLKLWAKYQNSFYYAKDISFYDCLHAIELLME